MDNSGIYAIRNIVNGKRYVGSSINIIKRWKEHRYSLKHGVHHSVKLQRAYDQVVDKSRFEYEILEYVDQADQLFVREQYYIDLYDSYNTGYNCSAYADRPSNIAQLEKALAQQAELRNLYCEFWNLYDINCIVISDIFMSRIRSEKYKNDSMFKLISSMQWFYGNYSSLDYYLKISFAGRIYCADVYDRNNLIFDTFLRNPEKVNITKDDLEICTHPNVRNIEVDGDGYVHWIKDSYPNSKAIFSDVKSILQTHSVKFVDGELLIMN